MLYGNVFSKNEKCSNPECFISKKCRQRFFKYENFTYRRTLLFELLAVELAILLQSFLNRSPWLKADENSTKVLISTTNFSNKIPISENYQNLSNLFCQISLRQLILFKFTNITCLHLLMSLPNAKYNKAVGNSGFKVVLSIFNKIWKNSVVLTS